MKRFAAPTEARNPVKPKFRTLLQVLRTAIVTFWPSSAKIGHVVDAGAGYGFHDDTVPRRPLLKIHPVTGRPALYIGRHAYGVGRTDGSENLSETESQLLLDELDRLLLDELEKLDVDELLLDELD